jgi:hypothetical protein
MGSAASGNPYRAGGPQPKLPWRPGPVTLAAIFFTAGAAVPGGCATGLAVVDISSVAGIAIWVAAALALFASVAILHHLGRARLSASSFACGVAVSVAASWFVNAYVAEWYENRRCLQGDAKACYSALLDEPSLPHSRKRDLFRRGCALGVLRACADELKYDPANRDETCASLAHLCSGGGVQYGRPAFTCELMEQCPDPAATGDED